jgi:hypothetical protein
MYKVCTYLRQSYSGQQLMQAADSQGGTVTRRGFEVFPIIQNGGVAAVNATILDSSVPLATLNIQCVQSLTWLESL